MACFICWHPTALARGQADVYRHPPSRDICRQPNRHARSRQHFGFRAALPFVAGVALGKQLIIWPVGFGLMELSARAPWVFEMLKYISAAYIIWLAWKVANLRLGQGTGTGAAPGFAAGLIVHPLNPKAWAMIVGSFTAFVAPETPRQRPSLSYCCHARSSCTPCGPSRVPRLQEPWQASLPNPI
jgi:hypothetical protein